MGNRWTYSEHTVFDLQYQIVWCTKYKKELLDDEVSGTLRMLIERKVKSLNVDIDHLQISASNVQLRLNIPPSESPHHIILQLKAHTFRGLRKAFPHLKKRVPTIWTRHYYCQTIGEVKPGNIESFLAGQVGL